MNHVKQPENSNLCGQACVAMIAGISLEESINIFGKRGCTSTTDVIKALNTLQIPCGESLIRLKKGEDPAISAETVISMVVLHFEGTKHTHWVVLYGDLYYDPALSIGWGYEDGVRITSYLPIYATEQEGAQLT